MDFEQYKDATQKLKNEYNYNLKQLMIEYAKTNAKANIGDIVIDCHSEEVFKVGQRKLHINSSTSLPEFQYLGSRLKKDFTPMAKPKESFSFDFRVRVIKKACDAK